MKNLCPVQVFDIEDSKNIQKLKVKNPEKCTFCRACINDEKLGDKIKLAKERGNYRFTIESIGAIDPMALFTKALDILIGKSQKYKEELNQLTNNSL